MQVPNVAPCRRCGAALDPRDVIADTVVCPSCGSSYAKHERKSRRGFWSGFAFTLVLLLAAGYVKRHGLPGSLMPDAASRIADPARLARVTDAAGIEDVIQACLETGQDRCLRAAYERAVELAPRDFSYRANLAFTLTRLKEHERAVALYQSLVGEGEGTYDLMAYYGESLVALGRDAEAERWLMNALGLVPNLVDVTERLSQVLVRLKRPTEAASLLESFLSKYPAGKGRLQGRLVAIRENLGDRDEGERTRLRLLALADTHHVLPIGLGKGKPAMFMVDTGATAVTMNEATFRQAFPAAAAHARAARLTLADGRRITGRVAKVDGLRIGPWTERDVEVVFCASCSNLAGKSLLSRYHLKMFPRAALSVLELSR